MTVNQGEKRQNPFREAGSGQNNNSVPFKRKHIVIIVVAIVLVVLLANSLYIVREDEVATVKEFGEIKSIIVDSSNTQAQIQNDLDPRFKDVKIITDKGLRLKIPFITTVEKDTSKLLTYMSNSANINTRDKLKYEINMYAQWEITHPGIFRTSLGTINQANSKIDEVTYAVVIEKINSLTSNQFLTDKEALALVLDEAMVELNENLATQGITLKGIEIYRTILPSSNIDSTYQKMIAEREAIAQQVRSEGLENYQNTVADTDRNVAEIKASAIEESETIRGEADATALEIYANGFSKDPDFYEFWRTLKSYELTIDEDTVIYMDSDNDYLNYFSDSNQ